MAGKSITLPRLQSLGSQLSSIYQILRHAVLPAPPYPYQTGNDAPEPSGELVEDIKKLGFVDLKTLRTVLKSSVTGVINDNDLLQEHLVQLLAKLPEGSKAEKQITDAFINTLWDGLAHPPVTTLDARDEYAYRQPDGSKNSLVNDRLGAAGTTYARSVKPEVFQAPASDLPDPGLVFDPLMARNGLDEAHPNGISSTMFYFATIIIHDIFQTDGTSDNWSINLTSSYLDLSPLYGRNWDEQKAMRTFKDGLLKPDCFSSKRILGFPPGTGLFLIMFNRFHNYVVTQLANINEGGRFNQPKDADDKPAWKKREHELFQTGRLITCGLFANIILRDYVGTILSLNRIDSNWALDPRTKEAKNVFRRPAPEGIGNQVSAEFNLIYRWHSAISKRDEQWIMERFGRMLPAGSDAAPTANMPDVIKALHEFETQLADNPEERELVKGLQRRKDGTYEDDELMKILKESIEDVAGSFGANRVPNCMRSIEMLGILQARAWKMATLNEFRAFVGLSKHQSFEDINPDPDVARKLMHLYDSPDSVELYPGLVAEKPKPPMAPGSGICVNYTISRAILSDATALVRGDRFYTVDYNAKKLTNWGYNEVNYDPDVNQGHVVSKLIFRAFPNHFKQDSVYAHLPFVTPSENRKILAKLGRLHQFSWDAPSKQNRTIMITSNEAVRKILDNKMDFKVTWGNTIQYLTAQPSGSFAKDFCLSDDGPANATNRQHIIKALTSPTDWEYDVWQFYNKTTSELLAQKSFGIGPDTREVDVVRDVIGLANTRFMAALFSLPIKSTEHPQGVFTESEMVAALGVMFMAVFMDVDVANSFKLRTSVRKAAQQIGQLVLLRAEAISKTDFLGRLVSNFVSNWEKSSNGAGSARLAKYGDHMIERMLEKDKSAEETFWGSIIPICGAGIVNQSQVLSQCLDYYLGQGQEHLPELRRLVQMNTKEADETLMKYMLEGCRLRATVAIYRDVATEQHVTDYEPCIVDPKDASSLNPMTNNEATKNKRTVHLPTGSRVMLNLYTAGLDAAAFPETLNVRLDRPLDSYMHYGWGPHQCLGIGASRFALTAVFRVIVGLQGLQRAPGPRGLLKSMSASSWAGQIGRGEDDGGWSGMRAYMTPDQSSYWPIPSTMRIRWTS